MFKTKFIKIPPKTHIYRCYKNYSEGAFLKDLILNLNTTIPGDYNSFVNTFTSILDKHAQITKKILPGNNKPYVNKALRKAISTRSRLRKFANSTGDPNDVIKYRKQRDIVKYLNSKTKKEYFKTLDPHKVDMNKKFWQTFKPFFSSKDIMPEKMIIVEMELYLLMTWL